MAFVALHPGRTVRGLNRLDLIQKVPMRALLRFVVIKGRLSSVVLNVVSVRAFSSVMTA